MHQDGQKQQEDTRPWVFDVTTSSNVIYIIYIDVCNLFTIEGVEDVL